MNTEKMVKTAKVLDKVFMVIQRIAVICSVVCVIVLGTATVLNAANPDIVIGRGFNAVDIGRLTFELAEDAAPGNNGILIYAWVAAVAAIILVAVICYALGILRKILQPIMEERPFAPAVSTEIRKLAFSSLALGVAYNLMDFIESLVVVHIYDWDYLLQNSRIQSVTVTSQFDVTFILAFFVLLLISYVFQYGEGLQKQSDETL